MLHAHNHLRAVPPPSQPVARLALVAGEFVTALLIICGGGWLTALASLR